MEFGGQDIDFGGDELDQFFGEEACDEFVKGINVEIGEDDQKFLEKLDKASQNKEEKQVFAAVLVENDQMLKSAVFGVEQSEEFQIDQPRNLEETVEILLASKLSGSLITDNKEEMTAFITERFDHFNGQFTKDQTCTIVKSLMNKYAMQEN